MILEEKSKKCNYQLVDTFMGIFGYIREKRSKKMKELKLKATNDWILVKEVEDKEDRKSPGGIYIPKKKTEDTDALCAEVIQISPRVPWFADKEETTVGYEVGDIIWFYGKTGIKYEEDGVMYRFMKWDSILATSDKEDIFPKGEGE